MRSQEFPGTLIVVEGPDGSGTTTQATRLADEIDAYYTAEHGDRRDKATKIGEKVEDMISSDEYSAEAIALAFAADRMVHLEDVVIPKLKKGETVVSDRYYYSSLIYQPALGADREWVEEINRFAVVPDLTVVLDVSAETGMSRLKERGEDGNIFEELSFQEEVVERYRRLPDQLDENVVTVDASGGKEEVFDDVLRRVEERLG